MKILYGVQATGNGHITRARAMAPFLKAAGLDVTYLFSGRAREDFFDMEAFGDFKVHRGLTFQTADGHIQPIKTFQQNSVLTLLNDIRTLNTKEYDLVLTDFEPITAWAARRQKTPIIGVGHQYAFGQDIPQAGKTWLGQTVLKWFAPASKGLGVHWHHFGHAILPPIIHTESQQTEVETRTVLVYLPFENPKTVIEQLYKIEGYQFYLHCKGIDPGVYQNVEVFPFSRDGFQHNLARSESVLCNAGFELVSEALQFGKRIMVKPLAGQMEQASNAMALEQLKFAWVMEDLDWDKVRRWLAQSQPVQVQYPNVAKAIVEWIARGEWQATEDLVSDLWGQVHSPQYQDLFA